MAALTINDRTIWEQSTGDGDRNYADLCILRFVILNGPGNPGNWHEQREGEYLKAVSSRKRTDLWRFCEEMKSGDIVVLKQGMKIVRAVGVVVGEYEWHEGFGDIDGWDLQHVRRVRWLHTETHDFQDKVLKWGDTTQKLISPQVLDWIGTLELDLDAETPVSPLPKASESSTSLTKIAEHLFDRGLASDAINSLTKNMDGLVRIANWYTRSGAHVSEAETIAYLVIPFLTHLGWTPQRMAIEWKRIDVALFHSMPREADNLAAVVEVKRRDSSCLTAQSQAESYALEHGCNRLIVTDGIRYGLFDKSEQAGFRLSSYLNITSLVSDYPILGCRGAQDAILGISPLFIDGLGGHASEVGKA